MKNWVARLTEATVQNRKWKYHKMHHAIQQIDRNALSIVDGMKWADIGDILENILESHITNLSECITEIYNLKQAIENL